MDYALAKRLKDAGWPQPNFISAYAVRWMYPSNRNSIPFGELPKIRAYAPTTDELIEALGNQLHATFHDVGLPVRVYRTIDSPRVEGENLRIALSELWLTPEVQKAIHLAVKRTQQT